MKKQGATDGPYSERALSMHLVRLSLSFPTYYFSPRFFGLEELDLDRPALWVGNHTLYGMLDVPLWVGHLYTEYGVLLRSLGDKGHFAIPVWRDLLQQSGVVLGCPDQCRELMASGKHILVFPGGAREVCRRKGEVHSLIWKQRTGFARLAIEYGYDIIPFASVGPDYSMDILWDAQDTQASTVWRWLAARVPVSEWTRGGDIIPPIVKGLGLSSLPRPERFYFACAERISTAGLATAGDDAAVVWALREQVKASIMHKVSWLDSVRREERVQQWHPLRRWLTNVK